MSHPALPDALDLVAYADRRLNPGSERGRAVAAYLAREPAARATVDAYRSQDAAIRRHYAPVLTAPLPPRLRMHGLRRDHAHRWRAWRVAAAVTALVSGVVLLSNDPLDTPSEAERFARAIARQLGTEIRWAEPDPPVQRAALAKLAAHGFRLAGQREIQTAGEVATEVVFEDGARRNVRLFIRDLATDPDAPRWLRSQEHGLVYWREGARMFVLTGRLPERELRALALELSEEPAPRIRTAQPPPVETTAIEDVAALDLQAPASPAPRPASAAAP